MAAHRQGRTGGVGYQGDSSGRAIEEEDLLVVRAVRRAGDQIGRLGGEGGEAAGSVERELDDRGVADRRRGAARVRHQGGRPGHSVVQVEVVAAARPALAGDEIGGLAEIVDIAPVGAQLDDARVEETFGPDAGGRRVRGVADQGRRARGAVEDEDVRHRRRGLPGDQVRGIAQIGHDASVGVDDRRGGSPGPARGRGAGGPAHQDRTAGDVVVEEDVRPRAELPGEEIV
jgi:hypothetical protein